MSKDAAFWEEIFGLQGDAGSKVTSQLANDLSARQVNARITPGPTLQCRFQLAWSNMGKWREMRKGKEKKEGWHAELPRKVTVADLFCLLLHGLGISAPRNIAFVISYRFIWLSPSFCSWADSTIFIPHSLPLLSPHALSLVIDKEGDEMNGWTQQLASLFIFHSIRLQSDEILQRFTEYHRWPWKRRAVL